MHPWLLTAVIAVLALAALCLAGRWLFGPVLFHDLVRSSRRGRNVALRVLYAAALLLALGTLYLNYDPFDGDPFSRSPRGLASFAEAFFCTFVGVQLGAVLLLTPAYFAGAIAEEKDRKTLEFLLATDLHSREIVLGKLASRLGILVLLILTGLPILSLTQLWGGIEPALIAAVFAATLVTLAGIAALSLLLSVYARKTRDAIVLAYLIVAAYLGLSTASLLILHSAAVSGFALTSGSEPWTVGDLVTAFNAGNFGSAYYFLYEAMDKGQALAAVLPGVLRDYAIFHGAVFFLCTTWAVLRMRAVALRQLHGRAVKEHRRTWIKPKVGTQPMLWKEILAEPGLSFHWSGRAVIALIVLASFIPAVWIAAAWLYHWSRSTPYDLLKSVNDWVRIVGTAVACLTLLGVAVRAASSITGERDRHTLDGLLASPLDTRSILFAKWLASLLSVRWAWLWLCCIWVLGVATGGLYVGAVPWLVLAWLCYASFLSSLGLYFSATRPTTLQATLQTLIAVAALGGGHWLLYLTCVLPFDVLRSARDWQEVLVKSQVFIGTPAVSLAWLSFYGDRVRPDFLGRSFGGDVWLDFILIVVGLVFWSLAGLFLWRKTQAHLRAKVKRLPVPSQATLESRLQPGHMQQPAKARTPARRLKLKHVAFSACVIVPLAVIGWYAYQSAAGSKMLQDAIAEADRLDPGWRLEELEAKRAEVPDEQDSAPHVLAVRSLLPTDWLKGERGDRLQNLPADQPMSGELHWKLTEKLEEVEPALGAAEPLKDLPNGRFAIAYSPDGIGTLLPHLDGTRPVFTMLEMNALLQIEEEGGDRPIETIQALINAVRSLGDEPCTSSQLIRCHIRGRALRLLERTLANSQVSEKSLAALQELLALEEAEPVLRIQARGERAMWHRFLDYMSHLPGSRHFKWLEVFAESDRLSGWEQFKLRLPGELDKQHALLLGRLTHLVEATKLPDAEQAATLDQSELQWDHLPYLTRSMLSGHKTLIGRFRRFQAEVRCGLLMLAAERYRLKCGRWPAALEELAATGLPAPWLIDPFTGNFLCFRRLPDGVVIYSVGPDGSDNGGNLSWDFKAPVGTDVGFRFWDIDKRRRK